MKSFYYLAIALAVAIFAMPDFAFASTGLIPHAAASALPMLGMAAAAAAPRIRGVIAVNAKDDDLTGQLAELNRTVTEFRNQQERRIAALEKG